MNKGILKEIGLTDKEAEVYLTLLDLGSTIASKIHEKTGIQRRNIYDLLNKLIGKGLVSYITEGKKKYFQPKNPDRIFDYIDEQKERLEEKKKAIDIKELQDKFSSIKNMQEAEILRGIQGIKTILNDCLNVKEVLFISSTGYVGERLPYFWPHYDKQRIKKKIVWKLLLNYDAKNKPIVTSKFREYKILPKELSSPNVIYIYGDKVANVLWSEPPVSFVIRDKTIAESYKRYFEFLWKAIK